MQFLTQYNIQKLRLFVLVHMFLIFYMHLV